MIVAAVDAQTLVDAIGLGAVYALMAVESDSSSASSGSSTSPTGS